MLIKQVDIVGVEPTQRAFYGCPDMGRSAVSFRACLFAIFKTETKLCGNDYLITPVLESPAEQFLIGKGAITFGRIKEVAAQFNGMM